MKQIIEVNNTDELFSKLKAHQMFTCKDSVSGLNVRYNGTFTIIANPKINLIELNKTQLEINIIPGGMIVIIAVLITLFFWAAGTFAIVNSKLNIPIIIIIYVLPSIIWILQYFFNKMIGKIIIKEITEAA